MYNISEQQLDFILNDIRRNGIEMEELQSSLLDHVCCIIESELEENGDFEKFYFKLINKFYKKELHEIEEETISLLIYKNYYAMKKTMIISGIIAVALFTMGIILKFMHQPGAAVGIVSGIAFISLIFLPLSFIVKIKDKTSRRDKVLIGLGTFSAITICMGIMFKVMHWPGANMMSVISIALLMLVFLPVYFFTGVRNEQTKTNTIVSSLLIITGCGLFLTLIRSPYGSRIFYIETTNNYLRNEQLLSNEKKLLSSNNIHLNNSTAGNEIYDLCENLKSSIINFETGQNNIPSDFVNRESWLENAQVGSFLTDDQQARNNVEKLKRSINDYNLKNPDHTIIPVESIISTGSDFRTADALNGLIQIQMSFLQNERNLLAEK